jgi:hypothetical protein
MKYSCFGDLHIFDGWFMVFNATFNNIAVISWQLVLLVEKTGVIGENQVTDKFIT